MNRRAIIIWGIVIGISVIGIIITYVLLNNNGSSAVNNNSNTPNNSSNLGNSNNNNISPTPSEDNIEQNQVSGDYYYWNIMPLRLKSKLSNPKISSTIDHYYSKELGIAFAYEVISIVDKDKLINITTPENTDTPNTIYLHHFNEAKESGQSIEIIEIEDNLRFSTIPEIITTQILDSKQKEDCKIVEQKNRYSIIAKDTKVKDSTSICGKYSKGNNRFFIKPRQEGSTISKLIFVNAGSKEFSYDGSMQGQYWYESVILE